MLNYKDIKSNFTQQYVTRTCRQRNLILGYNENIKTTIENDIVDILKALPSNTKAELSNILNEEINESLDILNDGQIPLIQTNTITNPSEDNIIFSDVNVLIDKNLIVDGNITVNGTIADFSIEDFKINDNLIYINMAGTTNAILTGTQMLNPDNINNDNNKKYIGMIYMTGGEFDNDYKFTNSTNKIGNLKLCYNGFDPTIADSDILSEEQYNLLNNITYVDLDIKNLNIYGNSINNPNKENNIAFQLESNTLFEINGNVDKIIAHKNIRFNVLEDTSHSWALEINPTHIFSINTVTESTSNSLISFNPTINESGTI